MKNSGGEKNLAFFLLSQKRWVAGGEGGGWEIELGQHSKLKNSSSLKKKIQTK